MQSAQWSTSQRKSPAPDPSAYPPPGPLPAPPPSSTSSGSVTVTGHPSMATSATVASGGARSSSGSGKSSSSGRKKDNLSQIEKSVTHLLIATKQLLETLTQWSRHNASETDVSDVYVRLGYEFNIACRAFTSIGVDTSDLGPVPDLLRIILEETLSQEASPASLDRFLPKIRDIIISLLHGLKRKQQRLRTRQAKEGTPVPGQATRQASLGGAAPSDASLSQMLEETQRQSRREGERRTASGGGGSVDDHTVPARSSSIPLTAAKDESTATRKEGSPIRSSLREKRQAPANTSESSLSSDAMQSIPVLSPDDYKLPIQRTSMLADPPPPPPPPKQADALATLQHRGELERRASRRYSAYQISKHLGAATNGVPMIPPAQNSPIPNRGRDVKESLNAVRSRSSLVLSRQRSTRYHPDASSPTRGTTVNRISEEGSVDGGTPRKDQRKAVEETPESPLVKTPEDKLGSFPFENIKPAAEPALSARVNGPVADSYHEDDARARDKPAHADKAAKAEEPGGGVAARTSSSDGQFTPEQSPQPGKELTLFLQYKSKVKKCVLPDGSNELSFARLQLAFIEKFQWNTHSNGNDLPEIYVQDPVSGVRHELDSLSDVKERSVLVLNVEPLDEVKKHFDEGLGGLQKIIEGMKSSVDGHQLLINQVSQRQQEATKELARLAAAPPAFATAAPKPTAPSAGSSQVKLVGTPATPEALEEVQTLRRDLAVLRQTFTSFNTGIVSSMANIRTKAETVKTKAAAASAPPLEGDSGRAYVNAGKDTASSQSEQLLSRVDDLQDLVEDLRKDVLIRGVRPRPRQLEQVNRDISTAAKDLKKYQELIRREKPTWTRIWEQELQTVCTDREFLTLQEDITTDLGEDIENVTSTLALIEDAIRQQNALQAARDSSGGELAGGSSAAAAAVALRSLSRDVASGGAVDPQKAKDGVLGEVRALQPNHASRLEAIERAERNRARELALRREGAAFKRELAGFVADGKLKKSGGVAETERVRRAQDERNIQAEWEGQAARKAARAQAREQDRLAQAAAQDAAEGPSPGEGAETAPAPDPDGRASETDDGQFTESSANGTAPSNATHVDGQSKDHAAGQTGPGGSPDGRHDDGPKTSNGSPTKRTSWLPAIFST